MKSPLKPLGAALIASLIVVLPAGAATMTYQFENFDPNFPEFLGATPAYATLGAAIAQQGELVQQWGTEVEGSPTHAATDQSKFVDLLGTDPLPKQFSDMALSVGRNVSGQDASGLVESFSVHHSAKGRVEDLLGEGRQFNSQLVLLANAPFRVVTDEPAGVVRVDLTYSLAGEGFRQGAGSMNQGFASFLTSYPNGEVSIERQIEGFVFSGPDNTFASFTDDGEEIPDVATFRPNVGTFIPASFNADFSRIVRVVPGEVYSATFLSGLSVGTAGEGSSQWGVDESVVMTVSSREPGVRFELLAVPEPASLLLITASLAYIAAGVYSRKR